MGQKENDTVLLFKNALLQLLEIKPLESITVSEIVTIAGRGRTTFYIYYDDVFSLYSVMIEENVAPLDQFLNEIKNREDQMRSSYNYGGIFDVVCKNKRFYYILFRSNEQYFLYRLRKVISKSMRSASNIPFPNYCYIVFSDRFIDILKSLILEDEKFKGEWLVHTCVIWLNNCGNTELLEDTELKEWYAGAVADMDKYVEGLRISVTGCSNVNAKIKESFLRLLKFKPYWDISVVDIVKDAGISRSVFYKFYKGTDALYENICNDVIGIFRKMFMEHNGSYYDIICKISALIAENKDIVDPLLSYPNSMPFNNLFIDYMTGIQKHYFGLNDRSNLHNNIAKTFLDVYEIFSHDEMGSCSCYESIIYGRCCAVSETFKFNTELVNSQNKQTHRIRYERSIL